MKITVGVIAYNEQGNIETLLENLINQVYPHNKIEIILVDGMSKDETKLIMLDFQNKYQSEFLNIKVLDNEKRIQPCGWNIVINNATTEAIIRVDAHAIIPNDFVTQNVMCLETGEDVCGGTRTNIIDSDTFCAKSLLLAEVSMFGSGIAKYRNSSKKEYVNSVAHACYRKEVFDNVGLFNEKLLRSEDNDMHYRIRSKGYKICLEPKISSSYMTRNTFKNICKQKYGNGKWVGGTSKISPKIFSIYHFVPLLFILGIIFTTILALSSIVYPYTLVLCLPSVIMWGTYIALILFITTAIVIKNKNILFFLSLPIIIFALHISYGIGTVVGIFAIKKKDILS